MLMGGSPKDSNQDGMLHTSAYGSGRSNSSIRRRGCPLPDYSWLQLQLLFLSYSYYHSFGHC